MSDSVTPMNRSMPSLSIYHQIPESSQTHFHCVGDVIQPSHPLSSHSPPALNLSQHQYGLKDTFPTSQLFVSGGQSIGDSVSTSVLLMNTQDWYPLGWTGWNPCSPRGSQESSPTPQFKSINSSELSLFLQSGSHIHIWLVEKLLPWLAGPFLAE